MGTVCSSQTMARTQPIHSYKPLHLITNLTTPVLFQVTSRYGISIEDHATHKQGTAQEHVHAYITWPVIRTEGGNRINPRRPTFVKFIRRNHGCDTCRDTSSGEHCPNCYLFLKFIWPHDQAHVDNIKKYIANPATEAVPISKELDFRGHYSERDAAEEVFHEGSA